MLKLKENVQSFQSRLNQIICSHGKGVYVYVRCLRWRNSTTPPSFGTHGECRITPPPPPPTTVSFVKNALDERKDVERFEGARGKDQTRLRMFRHQILLLK